MFFAEDGLYLDYRKFFNNALKPVKGNKYPGRPFEGKGKYLTYNINYDNNNNEYRIILRVEAPESPVNEKEKVITVKDIEGLVVNLVDSDLHNNIYLVYNYWKRDQKTHKITKKSYIGIKYNEQFNQISQFQFIPKDMLDLDYTKNVRLTQEGKLYLMHFTPKGVQILRWP
jgi:hypothetical protein